MTNNTYDSLAQSINDSAFCLMLDLDIDPGKAYDLTMHNNFIIDALNSEDEEGVPEDPYDLIDAACDGGADWLQ